MQTQHLRMAHPVHQGRHPITVATFASGGPAEVSVRTADKPNASLSQDPAYEARDIDLPFLR